MKQEQASPPAAVRPGRVFRIIVCCVTALYGWVFGLLSLFLYALAEVAGGWIAPVAAMTVGPLAGLGAALVWCGLMDRYSPRQTERVGPFLWIGAGLGTLVGLAAAAVVHGALVGATGLLDADILGPGAAFGLGAGAFLGLILGSVWYAARKRQECLSRGAPMPAETEPEQCQ
jgi:hypothetical protein